MAPTVSTTGVVETLRVRRTPFYLNVYQHQSTGKGEEKRRSREISDSEKLPRYAKHRRDSNQALEANDLKSVAGSGTASEKGELANLGKRPHSKVETVHAEPARRVPRACVPSQSNNKAKTHDKYCHFCQHVKVSMLACEAQFCTHRFCTYCLSVHLGDDVSPDGVAWKDGKWNCPTCRSECCCSNGECTRNHRHCKAYRYRCRRANAAKLRNTAAHALVSLAGPLSSSKSGTKAGSRPTGGRMAVGLSGHAAGQFGAAEKGSGVEKGKQGGHAPDVLQPTSEAEEDGIAELMLAALHRCTSEDASLAASQVKEEVVEFAEQSIDAGEEAVALTVLLGLSTSAGSEQHESAKPCELPCGMEVDDTEEGEVVKPELRCSSRESSAPSTPPRGGGEEA